MEKLSGLGVRNRRTPGHRRSKSIRRENAQLPDYPRAQLSINNNNKKEEKTKKFLKKEVNVKEEGTCHMFTRICERGRKGRKRTPRAPGADLAGNWRVQLTWYTFRGSRRNHPRGLLCESRGRSLRSPRPFWVVTGFCFYGETKEIKLDEWDSLFMDSGAIPMPVNDLLVLVTGSWLPKASPFHHNCH